MVSVINVDMSVTEEAPCAKQTTVAIIIKDGDCWVGTNRCSSPQEECPRGDMPTGVGYEKCKDICGQEHHAEVDACLEAGENARGGIMVLMGHYYCCDDCLRVMEEHGIEAVYILGKEPHQEDDEPSDEDIVRERMRELGYLD